MARWNRNGKGRDTLSRDERSALYGQAGFAPLQATVRCPDCRDNELSPPSDPDPDGERGRKIGPPNTYGCENCGGTGRVPAHGKERLDPYMTPKAIFG